MEDSYKLLQVNLHHAKGASDTFCRRFAKEQIALGLIQEPWAINGLIKGIPTKTHNIVYKQEGINPRAAIVLRKDMKYFPITEFISRDLVTVGIDMLTEKGPRQIIVASAYFPGDTDLVPNEETTRLINHCHKNNLQFIIGCDANAHNIVWGSTDTNTRGEMLLEYLNSNNVSVLNVGTKPTFINSIRQEVLDLTLSSPYISNFIYEWHMSEEA